MGDPEALRAELEQTKRAARRDVIRGLAAIATAPVIALVAGIAGYAAPTSYQPLLAAVLVTVALLALIRGLVRVVRGTIVASRARRELQALDAALPAARIVDR